jgi:FkbM family methyltransferase
LPLVKEQAAMKRLARTVINKLGYDIQKKPKRSWFPQHPLQAQRTLLDHIGITHPTIFDVGAHHGEMALKYKKDFPQATIYCFEPFPEAFRVLQERLANLSAINLFPLAISDTTTPRSFFVNHYDATNSLLPTSSGTTAYYSKSGGLKEEISVPSTTLDEFINQQQLATVDILKLDIQGGELMALRGATQTLQRQAISLIFSEVLFTPHYEGGALFYQLCDFLSQHDYTLFDIYGTKRAPNGQLTYGDAIFVNKDLRSQFIERSTTLQRK